MPIRSITISFFTAGLMSLLLFGCYSGSPVQIELGPPALLFPTNGKELVPDTLTLTWDAPSWTISYTVQVSTHIDFSMAVDSAVCTSQSLAITSPLINNTTYYWRVSASDGERTSGWSSAFSFTTGVAAPELLAPEDKAIWLPETLTLVWKRSTGDSLYYVQVSSDSNFSTAAVNDSTDSAFFAITSPLTLSTLYFWRISVVKRQGESDWSESQRFTTVDSLPPPALLYPADGAIGVLTTDSLKWDSIPSYWASYRVQVSATSNFSNAVIDTTIMAITAPINSLSAGTYYWRVAARLYLGEFMDRQGNWSAVRSFTTQ